MKFPIRLPAALAAACFALTCSEVDLPGNVWLIDTTQDYRTTAQEAMIDAQEGDTIHFRAGTYTFTNQLSLDGKIGLVIRGEGRENTMLDFSGQISGAQGILADDMTDVIFADLTVQDPPGDGIKVKDSEGISFIRAGAVYTGEPGPHNGAYGLYPVTSSDVLVEDCYVRGASDAGIYVGQSSGVHVTGNLVEECVAGIEIENCISSDVYGNTATHNTGGILVFDLPTLPVIKNGHGCRVFDNDVIENRHLNFAPPGNTVGTVPPGTGIMILAAAEVEVFDNRIHGNNILGVGIVSYRTLVVLDPGSAHDDTAYDPYVYDIHVHGNDFQRGVDPGDPNVIGFALAQIYGAHGLEPDIVYDGDRNPDFPGEQEICVGGQTDAQFVNIDAIHEFDSIVVGSEGYECSFEPLPAAPLDAPRLDYATPRVL